MEKSFSDIIILAGGSGERLWPASLPSHPKQFIFFHQNLTLLQHAVIRALALKPQGKIIIAGCQDILPGLIKQLKDLKTKVSIEEKEKLNKDLIIFTDPSHKNTAAPILALSIILNKADLAEKKENEKRNILMLTSDHVIYPLENFIKDCEKACYISSNDRFCFFGIEASEPSSEFGYIEYGDFFNQELNCHKITSFIQKPDKKDAENFIEKGNFLWNSGMLSFTPSLLLDEIKKNQIELWESFKKLEKATFKLKKKKRFFIIKNSLLLKKSYSSIKPISIEDILARNTDKEAVIKASFHWSDVGNWESFAKNYEKMCSSSTEHTVEIESCGNFIYSDIPVALCGVENMIIVVKNGKLLIMKKGKTSFIRKLVDKIKEKGL